MPPLFACKPGPNYIWTLTVGPVTMDWDEWAFLLNAMLIAFTLLSVFLTIRFGRWWMTFPIALVTAYAGLVYPEDSQDNFEDSWHVFVLAFPLTIVHVVVSLTIPKRKQPFDDWPDSWEPTSRFDPHHAR